MSEEYARRILNEPFPLSPSQEEAVLSPARYTRIISGAGSGKTETLTRRILYLLFCQKVLKLQQQLAELKGSAQRSNLRVTLAVLSNWVGLLAVAAALWWGFTRLQEPTAHDPLALHWYAFGQREEDSVWRDFKVSDGVTVWGRFRVWRGI